MSALADSGSLHFKILPGESLAEGLRRILVEQADRAISILTAPGADLDERIHDARVCFKRIRSVLRLLRREIGEYVFLRENREYRDAGRELSKVRDTAAMAETAARLAPKAPNEHLRNLIESLRLGFVMADRKESNVKAKVMSEVASAVLVARERIESLPITAEGYSILSSGLGRSYGQGRKRFHAAKKLPTMEHLHEWRKAVKHLRYQMTVISPIEPVAIKRIVKRSKKLGDFLSDYHDLALVHRTSVEMNKGAPCPEDLGELQSLIDRRLHKIAKQALGLGSRVYAAKPKEFMSQLRSYQHEAALPPAHSIRRVRTEIYESAIAQDLR
ncbi:MAG TPA: CHAD domain-containing protein [Blastocatellia bacterium]|nr:CHAD domain-containing protein [Blastocatellia bacterium]